MKWRNVIVVAMLIVALVVAGCAENRNNAPDTETPSTSPTTSVTAPPTEEVMDSEVSNIEEDMKELDSLMADMESIQDINLEGVGL